MMLSHRYYNPGTDTRFRGSFFAYSYNRLIVGIAIISAVISLIVFKQWYPFADVTPDTTAYIDTASRHLDAAFWPVGYSKFLMLVHTISSSETVLVCIQYMLLQLAAFFLYFSISRLLNPGKLFRYSVLLFLLINPLFLYLSNYVITEALFLALGLTWFALLLWICYKPGLLVLILHGIVLAMAFAIRYNAMFFPVVAIIPILMAHTSAWKKAIGIVLPAVLIILFIYNTANVTYRYTGVRKFSVFSSWQLASNALFIVPHVTFDTTHIPQQFKGIHTLAHQFCTGPYFHAENATPAAGAYFLWDDHSPLRQVLSFYRAKYSLDDVYSNYAIASKLVGDYGAYLIKSHPFVYARYFWMPNMLEYLLPGQEFIGKNQRMLYGTPLNMKAWFNTTDAQPRISDSVQSNIMYVYQILIFILHILFLEELFRFIFRKRYKNTTRLFNLTIIIVSSFLFCNFMFFTLAAPVVLRYQLMVMVLLFFASVLLLERNEETLYQRLDKIPEEEMMLGI
ncbi:hypothetical protein [Chitinophaga sp. Cy-1792]|uniref:hypothetical protein n=1 Tax=Chitinophaga sp. Cy-1792 TaxID=2608339 RepID=UPI00141D8341|nr:hypothetical protein [Chitinophaga sp. Cy-1792]NIG57135.1 hypothetical protein [Chitinophaga sp. Cy-1792]